MSVEREYPLRGSLFERIREAADPSLRRRSKETLLRSVRRNLHNVLNTRSGSCHGSPELGITDLNDDSLASSDFRNEVQNAISACILRYEPRISEVKVMAAAEDSYAPLELRFHILAYLNFSNSQDVLEFDILLDTHQHWLVE
ncbi:type VI secretion system baseplate subunit TssE [Pseudocitrobacter faecalis]|uniref:type VI secretion system baseplate subunit TssE n=1 Tax=Pseudocitrobacter faecalis TaxID=1398493 RepID=UPI0002A71DF3|nr:type VI secretion system lysozyme-related protein [Enterobacteriaceae bacterium strain FGI 57]